jgi:hypothetical protein
MKYKLLSQKLCVNYFSFLFFSSPYYIASKQLVLVFNAQQLASYTLYCY